MLKIVDFEPEDLADLLESGGEALASGRELLGQPGYGQLLKDAGPAWSGFDHYGRIVGCGGTAMEHSGCATAWTLLNPNVSGRSMLQITRMARLVLQACPTRRIQAHCDVDFPAAHRWLQLLGLQQEAVLRSYNPNGRDMALYSYVKR